MHKCTITFLLLFIISCSSNNSYKKETFDPSYKIYSSVLEKYVKGEKIDYLLLKENRIDLDHFINQLAGTTNKQLENMSENAQMAYWINAYNGITMRSIIDNYPTKSIQNIKGVWTETKWHIAEQELTLDYIEHKILRPTYQDARIHFAINCASIGCPPLYNKPFIGQNIDSLLYIVSSLFVQNQQRHSIDFKNYTIVTTELFSWFWEDFVRDYAKIKFLNSNDVENAILNFTYNHINDSLRNKFSQDIHWKISISPYDWSLNDIER